MPAPTSVTVRAGVLVGVFLSISNCDRSDAVTTDELDTAAPYSVHDSAGITISESRDSAWSLATAWTVDPEPVLQIGSRDGRPEGTAFGSVGPVLRFPDGRIAVGDRQALQVRVFSDEGDFLGSWSGPGDGPGEIRRLDDLSLIASDDLALINNGLYRHEIFRSDGSHARSLRAPDAEFFQSRSMSTPIVGWLGDGRLIVGPVVSAGDLAPGRSVVEGEWYVIGQDGRSQGLLARLPDRTVEVASGTGPARVVFYGPRATASTDGSGLWHGWPERWELRYVTSAGVRRLARLERAREAVDDRLADHFREWYETGDHRRVTGEPVNVDLVQSGRNGAERQARGQDPLAPVVADSLPAHGPLIVSRDGHVWIQEHATSSELLKRRPDQTQTLRWTVVDPDGRWLGTISTPEGLRIEDIGPDYILGVWLDELEVPYVRMHRIRKPGDGNI